MRRGSLSAVGFAGSLGLWLLPLVAVAQETKAEVRIENDIVFGKVGDTELKLDLAMPATSGGPFPAIVCIHAGGWIGGERQSMRGTIEVLARRGYVAISPDYRLAPQHRFPAQIEDCKAAIRWLRANADKYHVNPERIGAFGYSAGAHLACLLGVTRKEDGLEGEGGNGDESSTVEAVVSFFGPTDFTQPVWSKEVHKQHLLPFLGGTFAEKPDVYRRASPLTYAGKHAPPFLFVHGTADAIVPIEQSQAMVEKLRQAEVAARLLTMEGEGHGWGWQREHRLAGLKQMMDFFDETLKK